MLQATQQGIFRLLVFGLTLVLMGFVVQTSLAQDVETPVQQTFAASADYNVSLLAPNLMVRSEGAELVVQVTDRHGEPVHGVPVVFRVEPAWQGDASIASARVLTHNGVASARLRAGLTGIVRVTAQVGTITKQASIAVNIYDRPNRF